MEGDSSTTTDDLTVEERSGKRKRDSSEDEPATKKLRLADTAPHLPWELIREARPPFRVRYRLYSEIGKGNPPLPWQYICLLYTSPSPRDKRQSRMPSSA